MKLIGSLTCIVILASSPQSAKAALSISNWNVTPSSLSFTIAGTVTGVTQTPGSNRNVIFLAEAGNTSWINNRTNPAVVLTGIVDGNNVASIQRTVFSFDGASSDVGFWLQAGGMPPFGTAINFNFTDAVANEVNIDVKLTSAAGKWNGANINPANLRLFWGGTGNTLNGETTGSVDLGLNAVPELSVGILSLIPAGVCVARRRRA